MAHFDFFLIFCSRICNLDVLHAACNQGLAVTTNLQRPQHNPGESPHTSRMLSVMKCVNQSGLANDNERTSQQLRIALVKQ